MREGGREGEGSRENKVVVAGRGGGRGGERKIDRYRTDPTDQKHLSLSAATLATSSCHSENECKS